MSLHRIIRQAQGDIRLRSRDHQATRLEWNGLSRVPKRPGGGGRGHDQGISKQESEHKQTICETTAGFFVAVPWQSSDGDPI